MKKEKKTGGKGFFSFFLFPVPPSFFVHSSFTSSPLFRIFSTIWEPGTGYTLRDRLWSRCNILACEVRLCAGSKISSLAFLASFFSFTEHLEGFILVGKVLGKDFTILGLDERKARWVVKQDFHGNFWVNVTWFFSFFSGVLYWIVLILVWFESSLLPAQIRGQCCSLSLKLMTSQAVERTWIRTGLCLRASSPIWASEASLAKTRERGAEARFTRPNRRACSQATRAVTGGSGANGLSILWTFKQDKTRLKRTQLMEEWTDLGRRLFILSLNYPLPFLFLDQV